MAGPGGFLPYSPPPSSVASSSSPQTLPRPRSTPLKPGGSKESSFIRFADQQILHIQRRINKRDANPALANPHEDEYGRVVDAYLPDAQFERSEQWKDVEGYRNFAQAARDVEELVGVIWVSGTPSLQIPYLISIALLTTAMIPAFPASPRHLFHLLAKLDHAFASLLHGKDGETDERLPGFGFGQKVSTTEKVRIKSLVERTRTTVARVMALGDFDDEGDGQVEAEDGDLILDNVEDDTVSGAFEDWNMDVAKVYDKTLQEIGDSMEGPPIGIVTNM